MKRMPVRSALAFLTSLCLTLAAAVSQGEPAQSPLFISGGTSIAGKPNIMLMVDTSGSMSREVDANNDSRINIAKQAARNMVDSLTPPPDGRATVRVGLATYNNTVGGKMWLPVADLDAAHANNLKSRISGFSASGYTPLATTLLDIGHYFSTRDTDAEPASLTLHPGKANQSSTTLTDIFTHTDGALGLLGFTPEFTCRVVTETTTPDEMPADYSPPCTCQSDHYISGGAATAEAASSGTPIQMLVVGTKPTICTATVEPYCTEQNYFNTCSCAELSGTPPCPACPDDTGTDVAVDWDRKPSSVIVSRDSDDYQEIEADEDPNVQGRSVVFTTTTDSICELKDWRSRHARTCDDNDCYVRGKEDGICRVCATVAGTNPETCAWSSSGGTCDRAGDRQCPDDSYQHSGCDSIDDTWRDDDAHTHRSCSDMFCMNNYECRDENPGETWGSWNHRGTDDRGYRCRNDGDAWCDDWSHRHDYCRDWGADCLWSSGTCAAVTPETCNCSVAEGTKCVVDYTDISVGNGGDGSGDGYCETSDGDNDTGGELDPNSLCFNPTQYYTLQYNGSADIMGPYTGAQLNWYFSEHLSFTEGSLELPTTDTETDDCSTTNEPIENWCQKSFAILISDGLPNKDRTVSTFVRDYTGDCATDSECDSAANSLQLPGTSTQLADCGSGHEGSSSYCNKTGGACNLACQNGAKVGRAYETHGSDYLDDVAQALYEIDLRPGLDTADKTRTGTKNNLITYAIGFADPALNQSSVLSDAALKGGGKFFYAADADALASALNTVISDISSQVAASSSVATNSTQIDTDSLIYQGRFDTGGWFGDLLAFAVDTTGTLEDDAEWNAGAEIPSHDDRTILTYNPQAEGDKGVTFVCDNLGAAQKAALDIADCDDEDDQGVWRLNYLRGDATHEILNGERVLTGGETERRSTDPTVAIYRNRTRLDSNNHARTPDPWVLGDVVNSNPLFVYQTDYLYNRLPEGLGDADDEDVGYEAFRSSIASRRPMLYVGANDGMLHGFDASKAGATKGLEIVAYVPHAVYDGLTGLTQPGYSHRYFVDGAPAAGDAYLNDEWRTVLVGTTGAGGRGVFALDITDPGEAGALTSGFDGDSVLWEFSDQTAPNGDDLTTDTAALRGFANNLGYTLPQPGIVRMHDGSWVALVANGYSSPNNLAVLYLVDLETGHILRAFNPVNANESEFTSANGLSMPFAADIDQDRIADYLYAGDLRGNLWKFDVTSSDSSEWGVANSGVPLYVACDQEQDLPCPEDHRQPISSRPVVGRAGSERPGDRYMVYFGTGKYFEDMDNAAIQAQTFYGIVDNSVTVPTTGTTTRGNLVEQTTANVTVEESTLDLRTTTDNGCANDGWYTDLPDSGERVTTNPLLRYGRVIFTTLIPPDSTEEAEDAEDEGDPCAVAATSGGTGWLMELSASCGTPIDSELPPWDINGDNVIDDQDLIDTDGDDVGDESPTGRKSSVGIPTPPAIIEIPASDDEDHPECVGGECEVKVISGSSSNMESPLESYSPSSDRGRKAWYQIQ